MDDVNKYVRRVVMKHVREQAKLAERIAARQSLQTTVCYDSIAGYEREFYLVHVPAAVADKIAGDWGDMNINVGLRSATTSRYIRGGGTALLCARKADALAALRM